MNGTQLEPREKFLGLLTWIREMELYPPGFRPTDLFLNPETGHICSYQSLNPLTRRNALWLPDLDQLQAGKLRLEKMIAYEASGYSFVRLETPDEETLGMGTGEKEALLSALNELRRRAQLN